MHKIDLALQIATKAHQGITDADGEPYILHPLAVGLMGHTDEERMAGFLHDVVEDTEMTFEDLLEAGIPNGVVNALRLLTHDKQTTSYTDYVQQIIDSGNPIALHVKYNDLRHNYSRSAGNSYYLQKYTKPLEKVKAAIEGCSQIQLYQGSSCSTAIFAGGCYWGVQHEFGKIKGVRRTLVGYTGGEEEMPTYEQVRSHETHHVEAVLVEYDSSQVSYTDLCKVFFEIHDPAQEDGVGPDIGPQYRSCIFYKDQQQRTEAEAVVAILREKGYTVNTLLLPQSPFWIGEEYQQRYYEKTGGEPYCHMRVRKF